MFLFLSFFLFGGRQNLPPDVRCGNIHPRGTFFKQKTEISPGIGSGKLFFRREVVQIGNKYSFLKELRFFPPDGKKRKTKIHDNSHFRLTFWALQCTLLCYAAKAPFFPEAKMGFA
ncbi:MAG: hypothetical protein J6A21_07785 [Lentisphaeria bacterium]|nr:hypothetical protein [Lentisphaeria bacterium]